MNTYWRSKGWGPCGCLYGVLKVRRGDVDRIVGDDDGGKMFTEKQYEEYKKKNPHKVAALKKNFMDIAGQED